MPTVDGSSWEPAPTVPAMGDPRRAHRPFTCALAAAALLVGLAACSDDGGDADAGTPTTTAAAATDGGGGTIDVLTYNVAGLPQEISKVTPSEDIPLISPLLADYDVVLTQEDFDWWVPGGLADGLDFNQYHERLRADAGFAFATPVHPGPEAAGVDLAARPEMAIGDGIGIMADLPLDDFEVQAWEGCFGGFTEGASDCLAMKGFRVATMDLGDGALVDVYSLHGEAGGTEADQALQPEDFAQLAAYVASHSGGRAVIVGGDTNLHIDDHEDSGDGADAEIWSTFLDEAGLTDVCAATDCADPGIIDKVAIRSGDDVELTAEGWDSPAERFTGPDGEPLSDHDPVVATIGWAPAS